MKKIVLILFTLYITIFSLVILVSCDTTDLKHLDIPIVEIDSEGMATWSNIENATGYKYVINDKLEEVTSELSIALKNGDSIKVKALGDGINYQDSSYSKLCYFFDECNHQDINNDGYCDACNTCFLVELSFYAINDLHGKFIDTSNQPGVDELTTYFKDLYDDNSRYEILLSTGDMWQGTVESSSNKGQLMTTWMNELNFVSMTLGNHEFDWGTSVIDNNEKLADFPFLAINVKYNNYETNFCKNSIVIEIGGIKIGVIGAIGNCLSSISGEFSGGLSFATGDELTNLVKTESIRLRKEEDCKLIVYTLHDGYSFSSSSIMSLSSNEFDDGKGRIYYDTELSNGYIDFVFEGHTHQNYIIKDEYGVYHLQGGGENQYISCINISYNTLTDKYDIQPEKISKEVYGNDQIRDHEVVEEIFNSYFPDDNPYTTVIGKNNEIKYSDDICQKISELYLEIGKITWGSEYDIVLGGGFLNTRSPYMLPYGDVTYAQLFSLLPFNNAIVLGKISGEKLKSQFINTTNSSYYCTYNPDYNKTINSNQYYYIVVDTYTSNYKYNGITEIKRLDNTTFARDLLGEFIKSGGWNSQSKNYISIVEAQSIGNNLASNEESIEQYYITGIVDSIENQVYGNLYIKDELGNTLYIYRTFDSSGTILFESLSKKPEVGDTITIKGKIKKYVDYKGNIIIEIINAKLMEY